MGTKPVEVFAPSVSYDIFSFSLRYRVTVYPYGDTYENIALTLEEAMEKVDSFLKNDGWILL